MSPYRRFSKYVRANVLGYCLFTADQLAQFRIWDRSLINELYVTLAPALRHAAALHCDGQADSLETE